MWPNPMSLIKRKDTNKNHKTSQEEHTNEIVEKSDRWSF